MASKRPVVAKTAAKPYHIELDMLRIVAAVAVVTIHAVAALVLNFPVGSKTWWVANIADALVRWSVPVFVMLSGALLISPKAYQQTGTFLRRRFARLAVPLLIWPLLYILWVRFFRDVDFAYRDHYFLLLAGNPAPGHLYFLFLIANLYLLTPLISLFVSQSSRRQIWAYTGAIFAATFVWHAVETFVLRGGPPVNFLTQGLPYVGFFMLGYLLSETTVNERMRRILWAVFATSVALIAVLAFVMMRRYGADKGLYFYNFPTPFVAASAASMYLLVNHYGRSLAARYTGTRRARLTKLVPLIASTTFGVYLVHIAVIDVVRQMPFFETVGIVSTLISIPIIVILSFAAVWIAQRVPYLKQLIP